MPLRERGPALRALRDTILIKRKILLQIHQLVLRGGEHARSFALRRSRKGLRRPQLAEGDAGSGRGQACGLRGVWHDDL